MLNFKRENAEYSNIRMTSECRKMLKTMCNHVTESENLRTRPSYSLIVIQLVKEYFEKNGVQYNLDDVE